MSRKKSKMFNVSKNGNEKKTTVNINGMNLKKAYYPITFKTGKYITEKDRPRKKWSRYSDY